MGFSKLPANSKQLLDELVAADNPTQFLQNRFEAAASREDDELRGIIRELRQERYLDIEWADDIPYIVVLSNLARTYNERLSEYEGTHVTQEKDDKMKHTVFVSHRSSDKAIADMLVDFFAGTGIPKDSIFCSSLPGNDVNEKIPVEVKAALNTSLVNIAILSYAYYQSAYCLNEAGIIWFQDGVPAIPIALPEINSNNMYGFLSNEYKLRRLDCETDVSYVYDAVREAVSAHQSKASVIMHETQKLKDRYSNHLEAREKYVTVTPSPDDANITTDDERIILFYILTKNVRKVSKSSMIAWLRENEVYDVNVDNAFDLLSSFGGGSYDADTLELGVEVFRNFSANSETVLPKLKTYVEKHSKSAAETFKRLWADNALDTTIGLFIAYIVDERMSSFGDRWMANEQIEHIKQWESKNTLNSSLSGNYGSCLEFFKQHDLVYESSWTSYGNPRKYTLCKSLQDLLYNHAEPYAEELQKYKQADCCEFPF